MELWERLRHFELGWTGLGVLVLVFVAVLFLRRALPEGRRDRGRVSVLLLGTAPVLHLIATGVGLLGAPQAAAAIHLLNIALVVVAATGTLGMLVFDLALGRTRLPTILRDFTQVVVFATIVFIVLRSGGIEPLSVLTTSAVATALIGLALQNLLSNVLAGLVLQVDRTLTLGDYIQWGQRVGKIVEIKWRSSSIVTREGDTAIVPNATLVSTEVLNLSRPTRERRTTVRVPVHRRHSPGEVRRAMLEALDGVEGVLRSPAPTCMPVDFEIQVTPVVVYGVNYWVDDVMKEPAIEGAVRARIWYAAERAGIEGPCPGASENDEEARVRAIAPVPVFAPLDDGDRASLASAMRRRRFAEGEPILREGEAGDSLFVIDHGSVSVSIGAQKDKADARGAPGLATLGAGDCFGEMSLLTGDPRAATCIATTEVVCWEIEKAGLRAVLDRRPEVAEEISRLLATRQVGNAARATTPGVDTTALATEKARLLSRVRTYFNLG